MLPQTHFAERWIAVDDRVAREERLAPEESAIGISYDSRPHLFIPNRCSYEMVDKAASAGIALLVAISAPTDLAIRRAEEAGMALIGLARADGDTVFVGAHRVTAR